MCIIDEIPLKMECLYEHFIIFHLYGDHEGRDIASVPSQQPTVSMQRREHCHAMIGGSCVTLRTCPYDDRCFLANILP